MRRAEAEGTTVRAVGAGHAWSDAALTDGYLVAPDGLGGLLDSTTGRARRRGGSCACSAARTCATLNAALDARGLALPNMGGYDEQTIAGVVSTSTHGSGLDWGPFPDFVRSLDLVVAGGRGRAHRAGGRHHRPARASTATRRLIQDDATFDAAVCGMGTLGLIHSLVIEVREKFWLNEVRTRRHLGGACARRVTPDGVLGEGDHYELFVNPYAGKDGEHRARGHAPQRLPRAGRGAARTGSSATR